MSDHASELFANLHFVFGGARSGKSHYSEELVKSAGERVLYVATAQATDDEMRRRIEAHQARRPSNWDTLEAYSRTFDKLRQRLSNDGPYQGVIIDCVSVWASNIVITLPEIASEEYAYSVLSPELDKLFAIIRENPKTTFVLVSNEVGLGIIPAYPLGRLYRDTLGRINQRIVRHAATACFMLAGVPLRIKG